MEATGAKQALERVADQAVLNERNSPATPAGLKANTAKETKLTGYGMPCATCRSYYPADMHTCPICQSKDRVSARAVARAAVAQTAPAAPLPQPHSEDARLLAEERERLRNLKSEIYASHPPVAPATFRCALDQNHTGSVEPAAVCHSCYSAALQQAERVEAALRMDPKEAARIVYDAVWADPSDPNKTYLNAANALLTELRNRAGIVLTPGANLPLVH